MTSKKNSYELIPAITIAPMSYQEARLKKGPIYEALEKELWEGNYKDTAGYLHCLVKEEQSLLQNAYIGYSLTDTPEILLKLMNYLRTCEDYLRGKDCLKSRYGFTAAYEGFKFILQSNTDKQSSWLVDYVFKIIRHIFKSHWDTAGDAKEIIALAYALYGNWLMKTDPVCDKVVFIFDQALQLCMGESWQVEKNVDSEESSSLHSVTSAKLVQALICRAKALLSTDPNRAEELSYKTINLLLHSHPSQFRSNTYYERALVLIERDDFREALVLLIKAKKLMVCCESLESKKYNIRVDLAIAICLDSLGMQFFSTKMFEKALHMAHTSNLIGLEAETYYQIGRSNLLHQNADLRTRKALQKAEYLFAKLGNSEGRIKSGLLLAQQLSRETLPLFNELIKFSFKPCPMMRVRRWKDANEPFWRKIHTAIMDPYEEDYEESIDCHLKEHDPQESTLDDTFKKIDIGDDLFYPAFS